MISKIFIRTTFIAVMLFGMAQQAFSQQQTIISDDVRITKYHDRDELISFNKGQLLELYIQRVDALIKMLPNIAFTTKPGVTMSDVGIPDTKEHRKALEDNKEATTSYFEESNQYQTLVLPYADKSSLVTALLFYENILKSLHKYHEFD